MEDILKLVSTYGFPMVVAVYLLVRLEPLIRDLKESVDVLVIAVARNNGINACSMGELKEKLFVKAKSRE